MENLLQRIHDGEIEYRKTDEGVVNRTYITSNYVIQEPVEGEELRTMKGTVLNKNLHRRGAPVPEVLYISEEPQHAIYEKIGGVSLENRQDFDDSRYFEAMRNAGKALAEIHRLPVEGYGKPDREHDFRRGEHDGWRKFVRSYVDEAEKFVESEEFSEIVERASDLVNIDELPEEPESRTLHMDFTPDNIIVGEDTPVTVIDFDDAYFGDPMFDYVHSKLIMSKRGEDALNAFQEGYNSVREVKLNDEQEKTYTAMAVLQQSIGGEWCLRNDVDVDAEDWSELITDFLNELDD